MPPCPKPSRTQKQKKLTQATERQLLNRECEYYHKWIVRYRDRRCVTGGPWCWGYLTASHFIPRGKQNVRHDLRNIQCQCQGCNNYHNHWRGRYQEYMRDKYGQAVIDELYAAERVTAWKWTVPDLRDIRDALRDSYLKYKTAYENERGGWPDGENTADLDRARKAQGMAGEDRPHALTLPVVRRNVDAES